MSLFKGSFRLAADFVSAPFRTRPSCWNNCDAVFAMHSLRCTLAVQSWRCRLCDAVFAMQSLRCTLCDTGFAMHSCGAVTRLSCWTSDAPRILVASLRDYFIQTCLMGSTKSVTKEGFAPLDLFSILRASKRKGSEMSAWLISFTSTLCSNMEVKSSLKRVSAQDSASPLVLLSTLRVRERKGSEIIT
jgi:hypothetical protein